MCGLISAISSMTRKHSDWLSSVSLEYGAGVLDIGEVKVSVRELVCVYESCGKVAVRTL